MGKRIDLHGIFKEILGSEFVYFQPPESVTMSYPCILYELGGIDKKNADDGAYLKTKQYTVTIIDEDPDSGLIDQMLELPKCSFNRFYKADNLNHWVFRLFF